MLVKRSTAATFIVGPILDADGAEYTTAVIGDLSISKNGGTLTAMASAATLTHIANGQYTLVTTTGNLDTLGRAQVLCNKSTYQMPTLSVQVVPANVYDSLVAGSDTLNGAVTEWNGVALATTNPLPNAAADGAGGLPISDAGGLDLDAKLANTNEVTAARMAALTDWIDGGRLDLLLDAIPTTPMRGTDGANTVVPDAAGTASALIAALNDLSAADVAAELATYDGPTKAELDAAVALLATAAELAKVPKSGSSNTYTQTASDSGAKSATVAIS